MKTHRHTRASSGIGKAGGLRQQRQVPCQVRQPLQPPGRREAHGVGRQELEKSDSCVTCQAHQPTGSTTARPAECPRGGQVTAQRDTRYPAIDRMPKAGGGTTHGSQRPPDRQRDRPRVHQTPGRRPGVFLTSKRPANSTLNQFH
jgi:hypothetical protein